MGIRVLVVDDSAIFRRVVSDALGGVPGVEVVGTSSNGKLALARMAALRPDVVTLDIEMPEMNGIEVLEAMKPAGLKACVIALSALTVRGGELTVHALELGAFDFLTKPEGGSPEANLALLRTQLAPMIRAYERRRDIHNILRSEAGPKAALDRPADALPASPPGPAPVVRRPSTAPALVLIGVSTGGPSALATLVPALPRDLAAPVFIVQHMPPLFTAPLAKSLAAKSVLPVTEAVDGETAARGHVYLAPGGRHMKLAQDESGGVVIRITEDPPENNCRPAVDYLFRSAALQFPGRAVAAVLTGMGRDGTAGLGMLKRTGCFAIAQDEPSCVVFGMPKEAIQAGVVDVVAPLDAIAGTIVRALREVRS